MKITSAYLVALLIIPLSQAAFGQVPPPPPDCDDGIPWTVDLFDNATQQCVHIYSPGDPPVADAGGPYVADEGSAYQGGWSVQLEGSGSVDDYGIASYEWDIYSDGSIDETGVDPIAEFSTTGAFDLLLTVWDVEGQRTDQLTTVTISANDPPVAIINGFFVHDPVAGIWTVDFDASDSTDDYGIFKYEWDWDSDGVYDLLTYDPFASHDWSAPGDFNVGLRVTDHALQTDTYSTLVQIADDTESSIPVPTTVALIGIGLVGFGFSRKHKLH
ncbi:MAG: PKD domain-containing protein [Sedimenticola sp.]